MKQYYNRDADYIIGGETMQEIAAAVRLCQSRTGFSAASGSAPAYAYNNCEQYVKNNTETDWQQFACIKVLSELASYPDAGWYYEPHCLTGQLAGADDAGENLGILTEPVAAGEVGKVVLSGITPARLYSQSGEVTRAKPGPNGTLIGGETGPIKVIARVNNLAVVQLGWAGDDSYKGPFAVKALGNNQYKVYDASNPTSEYAGDTDVPAPQGGYIRVPVTTLTVSAGGVIRLYFHYTRNASDNVTPLYSADFDTTNSFTSVLIAAVGSNYISYQAFLGSKIELKPSWVL